MRRPIQHRLDAFGSERACAKLAPSTASPTAPANDHWWVTASVMIVAREALIGPFNDCFLILGLVALATMIPTLFLTDSRARNRSFR